MRMDFEFLNAATKGDLKKTEKLISNGANPKEEKSKGVPILFATLALPISHNKKMKSNKESIYNLLSQYFDTILQDRNESGDTIMHIMAIHGYDKLIDKLLAKDQTKQLASIPNNSMHYPIHSAILNVQDDCVKSLISVEGVEKLTDAKGRNALHYAAKYGDRETVQICLKFCAKDSLDNRGKTPLILASIANNTIAVDELLESAADINATDDMHRTALHYAVESDNLSIVARLLENQNVDVNISDSESHNPFDLVRGDKISELLIAHGAVHNGFKNTK